MLRMTAFSNFLNRKLNSVVSTERTLLRRKYHIFPVDLRYVYASTITIITIAASAVLHPPLRCGGGGGGPSHLPPLCGGGGGSCHPPPLPGGSCQLFLPPLGGGAGCQPSPFLGGGGELCLPPPGRKPLFLFSPGAGPLP